MKALEPCNTVNEKFVVIWKEEERGAERRAAFNSEGAARKVLDEKKDSNKVGAKLMKVTLTEKIEIID